ncbi:MAG: ABC transporter substrate-binding protein [Pirellulales bacterium]|nr:ABC transporter substrate-binding protein [Pirellulales bacterium]
MREICLKFVAEWKAGHRPQIENFLAGVEADRRARILAELIGADMVHRRALGEQPKKADYLERFPNDHPTVSATFSALADTSADTRVDWNKGLEDDISIGQKLGKYEIQSVLGAGGMGIVYGAFDTVIRRAVAIKRLSNKHADDEKALQRLLQEARTTASLQHPNIVAVHDVVEDSGTYYLVMEYVAGENLSQLLAKSSQGHLDWQMASSIIKDCCDALSVAHGRGMIHRDIKPQNIMVTKQGRAKLLDFGLAKSEHTEDGSLTVAGTILGTPEYMSPEQCLGTEADHRSDLYSLGATYFALLTGRPPFRIEGNHLQVMYAHCNETIPRVTDFVPTIPSACNRIVKKAMAKDINQRYQNADEFRADLESLSEPASTIKNVPPTPPDTTDPPAEVVKQDKKKPVAALAAIAGLLLVALVVGTWLAGRWDRQPPSQSTDRQPSNQVGSQTAGAATFRGVTADKILLGTSTVYSGPNSELGLHMTVGIQAYFASVNERGGVHGRKLELLILNDRYDPELALANMVELFEKRKVFAVIGNVGTPTARVTAPYAIEHELLFFAPFSGAALLREVPPARYVFNYRASYADETAAMVRYFVEELRIPARNIAVFAQQDEYGDDGFHGVARAMRAYGVPQEDLLRVGYQRNRLEIDEAVATVLDDSRQIQAIIMVPTYKVAARFIQRVRKSRPTMYFSAVSFVDGEALAEEFEQIGPESGDGVIVTQVVPHYASQSTGVRYYRQVLKKYYPQYEPGFVSLEGFIAARCLVEGLELAGPELNTEKLVDTLESIRDRDLGIGPIIHFSPSHHQASHTVWGTRLNRHGKFETFALD